MPEFRQDSISGCQVIIATGRAGRPGRPEAFAAKNDVGPITGPSRVDWCPFCPGNETRTPPEILALGRKNGGPNMKGWAVRVVPNKFPAVELKQEPRRYCRPKNAIPVQTRPGYGVHEVLIETPAHNCHPGALEQSQMRLVVEAYRQRYADLAQNENLRFIQIFRNHGREAGASIEHPHSQLIALPFIPAKVQQEIERAHHYYLEHGDCPYCRILDRELGSGRRVIMANEAFVAYIPFAARLPFETWIVPRRHQSSLTEMSPLEADHLAGILNQVLGLFARALQNPPYHYYLHGAPLRAVELPHYHWHLELIPKLTTVAGFEMGTGVFINTTRPEEAAEYLCEVGEKNAERPDLLCPGFA